MASRTAKRKLPLDEPDLSEKAQRFGVPDRWRYCPPMGKIVANKFLPMKTPLNFAYDSQLDKKYWFHPEDVFQCALKSGGKVGLWIDLSKTDRYYNKSEVESRGCIFKKLPMAGHKQSPTREETAKFIEVVGEFFKSHPGELVAIHCTHGFNRTGFLIVAYLVGVLDMGVDMAVVEFAKCRPNGIYKPDYLKDLRDRYGDEDDELEAPGRPVWEQGPIADVDFYYGMPVPVVSNNGVFPTTSDNSNGVDQNTPNNSVVATPSSSSGKPQFMDGRVPSVTFVEDEEIRRYLQNKAKEYCKFKKSGFPGSQPVSLGKDNLHLLTDRPYMVSWKADGMRYLVLIDGEKQIYAFDRDNNVFQLHNITFPHRKQPRHLRDTLVDAEMIIEVVNGTEIPRLLIYDIVAFEGSNVGDTDFRNRFNVIEIDLIQPRKRAMQSGELRREDEPIGIRRKNFWELEHAHKIYEPKFMQSICHEVDGLIFQPVRLPYFAGRCSELLKWKPPSMCTVDFLLKIEKEQRMGELPQYVGNLYVLHQEQPFAKMKATNALKPYDRRIIECAYDTVKNTWVFHRERTDKSHPNAYTTAQSVCNTIKYPIYQEDLFKFIAQRGYRHHNGTIPHHHHQQQQQAVRQQNGGAHHQQHHSIEQL